MSSRVGKENLKLDRVTTNQELLTEYIRMAILKNFQANFRDQIVQHKNLQEKEESNKCYPELWQVIVQLLFWPFTHCQYLICYRNSKIALNENEAKRTSVCSTCLSCSELISSYLKVELNIGTNYYIVL